jgi:serine/threonine protein kinase
MNTNNRIEKDEIIGEKYKLIRLITKGTFSSVYECEHILKGTRSVIKMESDSTAKKLMKHEIKMYLSLQKSRVRIPKIKNTGEHGDHHYMILELLDKSLRSYQGEISVYDLYKQLYLLHNEGIVHRDIKPDNFVIGFDKKIYMIDLGLAKYQDQNVSTRFIGNKRYASPTCFKANYIYQKKDDIVSLTYMILDLKYGFLPWDYEGYNEIERSSIDLSRFYPNESLCELLKLELLDYNMVFNIIHKTKDIINI